MATATGENLVTAIETSTGVTLNAVLKASLTAKLNQMIANGTYSATAAAIATQAVSTEIKAKVDANGGTAAFVNNVTAVKTAVENGTTIPTFGSTTPTTPTFTLTTGRDFAGVEDPAEGAKFDNVIKMTAGNDTIEGVVSALSSENTFNARDLIDAGAGKDTAKIALNSNFTGFAADGGMKGVENVELTNAGAIARTFDAKGVTGVEQYALKGLVSLTNLVDTKAGVSIGDIAETASVGIGFTADAVKGTADALTVGLNGLGTAEVKGTSPVAQKTVTVTANGIETLNVNATGNNFVALNGAQVANINVAGAGSITTTVAATTKTFDASNNTGNVKVDLAGTTGVTKVATGAGDDTITVAVPSLTPNAVIAGGEGNDRLELTGVGATTQLQMTGVETVSLGSAATALTGTATVFSAAKASGINAIDVQSNFAGGATFATLGSSDLNVNLLGANTNATANAVSLDHAGTSTINVTAGTGATATARHKNEVDVTVANSSHVTLNVGANAEYDGTINAGKASAVEVNGLVTGTAAINAAEATSAVLNTTGTSALALNGTKLTALNATVAAGTTGAGNGLTLTGTLTGVQAVEANIGANSTFTATGGFAKANTVNLTGTGAASVGALGSNTQEYGVTVNAGSLSSLNITGAINTAAGQNINVNTASVLGGVTLTGATVAGGTTGSITVNANGTTGAVATGTLTAKTVTVEAAGALNTLGSTVVAETATVNGSGLGVNTITLSVSKAATVVGGIQGDTFNIVTTGTGAAAAATVNFTGGLGTDTVNVTGNSVFANSSFTGVETLALAGNSLQIDGATLANLVTSQTAVTATTAVNTQLTVQATNAGQTIDASKVDTAKIAGLTINGGTGNDVLTGTAGNDFITGGTGDDNITGGKGADTLTGGTGTNTFVFAKGDSGKVVGTFDSIADFATGTANLLKTGVAGSTANYIEVAGGAGTGTAVMTLAEAITAGQTALATLAGGSQQFAVVTNANTGTGGDAATLSYVMIDWEGDDVVDEVIQLTGFTDLASISEANFIA